MRFSVKAKLASAFGAIIILSAITCGVAYVSLGELATTSRNLVSRADRMDKAAQLQAAVLYEVRAQKNMILSSSDADISRHADSIKKFSADAARLREEIYAGASEAGKTLMNKFSTEYEKVSKVDDEIIGLTKLNSSEHAIQYWKSEGAIAVKACNDVLDAELAKLERASSSVEALKATSTLQVVRMHLERTGKLLRDAFAASDLDGLNAALAALKDQLDAALNATQQAAAAATLPPAIRRTNVSAAVRQGAARRSNTPRKSSARAATSAPPRCR
jgi:methyl-accepting chemotaxis protein